MQSERLLGKLYSTNLSTEEWCHDYCKLINKAFNSTSAHIRARCVDILAIWCMPDLALVAGSAGELVLWHSNDSDARVRDRSYHCLLYWLTGDNNLANLSISRKIEQKNSKEQILRWFESNLESVYAMACRGLLDKEEMVRRTSLQVLGQLSSMWPHRELVGFSLCSSNLSTATSSIVVCESDLESLPIRIVDDGFSRICVRLQDPSRRVRQIAAQILSRLANTVTEECLLQTLEKLVMSDRQIHRSVLNSSDSLSKPLIKSADNNNNNNNNANFNLINLLSTGTNGAIITGLEDDYFEVRCATLTSVMKIAKLNTRFALNCQDLLVDMLTDDIQEVRFAAVQALCAVVDKVPIKAEQIAIISSALAEGSGRIRRGLHNLLSQCHLASAPCLIELLDGLLQNLRRYPQDRDHIWCCASLVGRNHPVFVDMCLSSLLRTHSWLASPEPNKEDPAYLTVLLLVLNAESGVPGMQSKFPRHLKSAQIYLRELLPSFLPSSMKKNNHFSLTDLIVHDFTRLNKQSTINDKFTLYRFVNHTIHRIEVLLAEVVEELNCLRSSFYSDCKPTNQDTSVMKRIRSIKYQSYRQSLLKRLIFQDLSGSGRQLDSCGHLSSLIDWFCYLSLISWYLCLVSSIFFGHCYRPTYGSNKPFHQSNVLSVPQKQQHPTVFLGPQHHKPHITKHLNKSFRYSLQINFLFSGKSNSESELITKITSHLYSIIHVCSRSSCSTPSTTTSSSVRGDLLEHDSGQTQFLFEQLALPIHTVLQCLLSLFKKPDDDNGNYSTDGDHKNRDAMKSRKRPYPFELASDDSRLIRKSKKDDQLLLLTTVTEANVAMATITNDDDAKTKRRETGNCFRLSDMIVEKNTNVSYLLDLVRRLRPIGAYLLEPAQANLTRSWTSMIGRPDTTDNKSGLGNHENFFSQLVQIDENRNMPPPTTLSTANHHDYRNNGGGYQLSSVSCGPNRKASDNSVRFTTSIISCSIRIRALLYGLSLTEANRHVCILFQRPDKFDSSFKPEKSDKGADDKSSSGSSSKLINFTWWPPVNAWHSFTNNDEDQSTMNSHKSSSLSTCSPDSPESRNECIELRTHLQLSASHWSDKATVYLALGYCLTEHDVEKMCCHSIGDSCSSSDFYTNCLISTSDGGHKTNQFILPLTSYAKVKLIPTVV